MFVCINNLCIVISLRMLFLSNFLWTVTPVESELDRLLFGNQFSDGGLISDINQSAIVTAAAESNYG